MTGAGPVARCLNSPSSIGIATFTTCPMGSITGALRARPAVGAMDRSSVPLARLDTLLPPEMARRAEEIGVRKATMDAATTLTLAILAGPSSTRERAASGI